ncbi:MAG: 50S ribosomal protein L20 [bacterium]|nr:50S ribosomal protein L20 [bacterium]
MARVKRGVTSSRRRKNLLSYTKGFRGGRKSKERLAKEAVVHAWRYAFRDRKANKRNFRRLWNIRIGAASREQGVSYSKLIARLKKSNIALDRKILALLAETKPEVFKKILEKTA